MALKLLLHLFAILYFVAAPYTAKSQEKYSSPELIVQHSNRTSIRKLAFNANGQLLAAVDESGFLIIRDVASHINFASIKLKNEKINYIKFEDNNLYVCGDYGLEVLAIKNRDIFVEKSIKIPYLYHYILIDNVYYFIGDKGRVMSCRKNNLTLNIKIIVDTLLNINKQLCYIKKHNQGFVLLGPNSLIHYDIKLKKITFRKNIEYNLSSEGVVCSRSGDLLLPSYKYGINFFTISGNRLGIYDVKNYKIERVDSIAGFEVGEMGIKAASIIDEKRKKIYLPEIFSASAIDSNGILALGDYNGNIFLYNPDKKEIIEKIPLSNSVVQYAAISNNGNLLAIASGNTLNSSIRIINLEQGKELYNSSSIRFDIAAINFTDNDSSIIVLYPDNSVDEIKLAGDKILKKVITPELLSIDNRSFFLINFNTGSTLIDSYLQEKKFNDFTTRPGFYKLISTPNAEVHYEKSEKLISGKMPSARMVNWLLEKYKLDKEEALYDQLEKDLFITKAISYDYKTFMDIALNQKVNINKSEQLFLYIQKIKNSNDKIIIKSKEYTNELSIDHVVKNIYCDSLNNYIYVIGEETITHYDINNAKISNKLKFRESNDNVNYQIDFKKKRFLTTYANKVAFYSLETMLPKFSCYTFDKSVLFQTPEGYYYTSSKVPQMAFKLHDRIFSFEQLDTEYNRPDKVLQAMGSDNKLLITAYKQAYEKRIKRLNIDTATSALHNKYGVPKADFKNRTHIGFEQRQAKLTLHITGLDDRVSLERFNVWVNEVPVFGVRGINLHHRNSRQLDTTLTVTLSQGANRLETSVVNAKNMESYRTPLYVNYSPAKTTEAKLYFVGIGIDTFAQQQYNLRWSTKDISDLARLLKQKYGDRMITHTLFNEQVNVAAVTALKATLAGSTVNDKIIVAYSGHGLLSKKFDYYLSTYSINFNRPEEGGLPYEILEDLLDNIPARQKLLLLDACHSGELDKEEFGKLQSAQPLLAAAGVNGGKGAKPVSPNGQRIGLQNSFALMQQLFADVERHTGSTIIAAAAGTQFAFERGELENGVFTHCILEYMNKHPNATVGTLQDYVSQKVRELTAGLQVPSTRSKTIAVDWQL